MWIFNKFNKIIEQRVDLEVKSQRETIEKRLSKSLGDMDLIYREKKTHYDNLLVDLENLTQKVNVQLEELKRIRDNADIEQKRLWERLDILRDSFTADQIWSKLWECAYSKAIDAVWPILEKEMPHLIELAENKAYLKAKTEIEEDYKLRIEGLVKEAKGEDISRVKILVLRSEIHEKMLLANRNKSTDLENRYNAQLEFIKSIIGDDL